MIREIPADLRTKENPEPYVLGVIEAIARYYREPDADKVARILRVIKEYDGEMQRRILESQLRRSIEARRCEEIAADSETADPRKIGRFSKSPNQMATNGD